MAKGKWHIAKVKKSKVKNQRSKVKGQKSKVSIQASMTNPRHRISALILIVAAANVAARAQEAAPPSSPANRQELPPSNDPKEIVRRSLDLDQRDFQLARNYTYEQRVEFAALDKKGARKHHELYTDDITILYDQPYSRRIRKDDKPLTDKEEKKEQEKLDRFVAKHKNESDREREQRVAKQEKQRQEGRAFSRDIINAYDFRMVGEEQVDGRQALIIEANPRKDFRPTQPHADILPKLRGKLWIDRQDYGWIKAEVETLDTISWGLFMLRIHKGTHMTFEQTRVNDEIWLPHRILVNASARFALFVNGSFVWESDYSDYKKFTSGARILPGVKEVQENK